MSKWFAFALLALFLVFPSQVSWGAVGVYKLAAGSAIPCPISYMLSSDADDTAGGWSVKIEIVSNWDETVVKTFKFLYPDPACTRGMHANVAVWLGDKDDGTPAPPASYKVRVTAKSVPVTGTDLKLAFENQDANKYHSVAVNNNPRSPYYGRVYATVTGVGVRMFEPDGTPIGVGTGGLTWTGSAPWGIAIDASDNIWVISRSGTPSKSFWCFSPDMQTKIGGPISTGDYGNAVDVYGISDVAKLMVACGIWTGGASNLIGKLYIGQAPFSSPLVPCVITPTGTIDSYAFEQPKLFSDGTQVKAYVPARLGCDGSGGWTDGALLLYTVDWITGAGTKVWANPNITLGTAVDIHPFGFGLGMSRNTEAAGDQFWLIDSANASSASGPIARYGLADTASTYKKIGAFRFDSKGNVVAAYGGSGPDSPCSYIGVFEMPDMGSTDAATAPIPWCDDHTYYVSDNGPVAVSSCMPNTSATVVVNVCNTCSATAIKSCLIDLTSIGGAGLTPMTLAPGGTEYCRTYTLAIAIPQGLRVGNYKVPISILDSLNPTTPVVIGYVTIRVTGGWISGKVTAVNSGEPIADATVTATSTTNAYAPFSTTTDSGGNYNLPVNPGRYVVIASNSGHSDNVAPATVDVLCGAIIQGINRALEPVGAVQPTAGSVKKLPDGTNVVLCSKSVTAVLPGGTAADSFYIEESNRSAGIRVSYPLPIGADAIGCGDIVNTGGVMATTAAGERYILGNGLSKIRSTRPVDAVGMNGRAARNPLTLGLFAKVWGKVIAAEDDWFTINDGSGTIRVLCGALDKPAIDSIVRVRGILSKDASGTVLLMRNEQVDWAYGNAEYQPLPFPGPFKYVRDFLICGPFADATSATSQEYRLDHDFIADATGGASSETTIRPKLGDACGGKIWKRSKGIGDNVSFTDEYTTNNTNCTFYAHLYVWSPYYQDAGMRVGSGDSIKILANEFAYEAHRLLVTRDESQGSDLVSWLPLNPGFNSILFKVENASGASGLNVQFIDPLNGGVPGYGGAQPLAGLGYLLSIEP